MPILLSVVIAAIAYLLGCISTGTIISNAAGVDIRKVGSHNTGASNVLRVLGLKKGLVTFIDDALKAALACLAGMLILPEAFGIQGYGMMLGGLFVILGHNWPAFFGFKGGKGVACSVAVIVFCHPLAGAISVALCILVIALTKYISVGSMTMLLSYLVLNCVFCWGEWARIAFCLILMTLCVIRHRDNIVRLKNGTENKLGKKVDPSSCQTDAK